jgi:hypothetical protein
MITVLSNGASEVELFSEHEQEKTEKKISNRKKRDPNAPKPATSAYQFFLAAMLPALKQEMPNIGPNETFKVLGQRWKALDDSDRKSYIEKAELSKQEYQEKLKLFKETGTCEATPSSSPVLLASDTLEQEIVETGQQLVNLSDKKEKHKHKKKRSAEESFSHDHVSHETQEKKKKKKKKRLELAQSLEV